MKDSGMTAQSQALSPALRAQEEELPKTILELIRKKSVQAYVRARMRYAVMEEREACAKIADDMKGTVALSRNNTCDTIAELIRNRSKKDQPRGLSAAETPSSVEGVDK